jgi:hypothetical protein
MEFLHWIIFISLCFSLHCHNLLPFTYAQIEFFITFLLLFLYGLFGISSSFFFFFCGLFVERESCSSYYDCRKKKDGEEHTRKLIDVYIIIIPQRDRRKK